MRKISTILLAIPVYATPGVKKFENGSGNKQLGCSYVCRLIVANHYFNAFEGEKDTPEFVERKQDMPGLVEEI
ncbi:MAG: hypothetical protein HRK26_04085 [Rickettsiaceae bacterium H1]|nr:hypothetical protein [Rickettsiaceae bacterium H1]